MSDSEINMSFYEISTGVFIATVMQIITKINGSNACPFI